MSLSQLKNYYAVGKEVFAKPSSTQPQTFNYPVVVNSDITMNNPIVVNNAITLNNNNKTSPNVLSSDTATGALFLQANYGQVQPLPASGSADNGLKIGWNMQGQGETNFINSADNGTSGFDFHVTNTSEGYLPVASFCPYKLPQFVYGPVAYGLINSDGTINSSWPLTGVTCVYTNPGVYTISIPGSFVFPEQANLSFNCTNMAQGTGPLTVSPEGLPTYANGKLSFVVEIINKNGLTQPAQFYFTVCCQSNNF